MSEDKRLTLLGSRRRTQVLELIAALDETYPREIATLLKAPLRSVSNIVDDLQDAGVLVSLYSGNQRRVSLNRRFFAYAEIRNLLMTLVNRDPEVLEAAESLRRRPRTKGKPVASA